MAIVEPDLGIQNVDEIATKMESLELKDLFSCDQCGAGYTKEGYLKRHMETKHKIITKNTETVCSECEKVFANAYTMEKHMKTHLKCKTCKKEFASSEEAKLHKKEHTFCAICAKDFYFASKLSKHVSSVHK